ncbi:helix-turn-helix domain-containing protein [Kineococcus glutinatus]|uniref:Helix-turn-helix domain-containing protein n=1 Tax=Kineococcus glutinatus TaxID=1070872 RepID=A0ABP9H922_9ACTN
MADAHPEDDGVVSETQTGDAPARSLAEKVDLLFQTVRPAKGEYSYEHVASAIKAAGGPTISAAYLWMLRNGKRDNPTLRHLEALASFFGVPPSYFFDDALATQVEEQLRLVATLRDVGVRRVALRASGLSSESLATIAEMIERVRKLEGLPDEPEEGHAAD